MIDIASILESHGVIKWAIVNDSSCSSYEHFKDWIKENKHAPLDYLTGERGETREDIKKYYPEFKSALVMLFDYSKIAKISKDFYQSDKSNGLKIANYVLGFEGSDYHYFLRDKLEKIALDFKEEIPHLESKFSLDTQPILERDLAFKAGLGWFGKNSMLINKEIGSYFIISSLLFNQDLTSLNDKEINIDVDHCGQCTRCIEACPTDAIDLKKRTIIANKCISTFTIEMFKDVPPPKGLENSDGEIFGCDICQDVCPWNMRVERQSPDISSLDQEEFLKNKIVKRFLKPDLVDVINDLESKSNREYRKSLIETPLARTGRIGMLKNLKFYKKKP